MPPTDQTTALDSSRAPKTVIFSQISIDWSLHWEASPDIEFCHQMLPPKSFIGLMCHLNPSELQPIAMNYNQLKEGAKVIDNERGQRCDWRRYWRLAAASSFFLLKGKREIFFFFFFFNIHSYCLWCI